MTHGEGHSRLILASGSPRRLEILGWLCQGFDVVPSSVNEDERPRSGEEPRDVALRLARAKAQAVASLYPEALVLGADTIVVLDRIILGKPVDHDHAVAMLRRLRGQRHVVVTGMALIAKQRAHQSTSTVATTVLFRPYSDEEIDRYVASGDPMDKAGAYGIQSESFRPQARVEGCLLNVIGLPLCEVARLLGEAGYPWAAQPDLRIPDPCRRRPGGCPLARI